ncbi:hypothetical protein HFD88_006724 [Aspergillus terreus]|nr:hypothetical protein HFD88_006724 [Aspergillus terreus]
MSSQPNIKWRRGLKFPSLEEGRAALIQHTIDQQQSFRVDKSDHKRFFTRCLSGRGCPYRVRLYVRRDTVQAQVNEYKPEHTCSPDTHVGWVPPANAQIQPEVNGAESEATPQNEPANAMSQDKLEETMKPDVSDQAAIAQANQFLENLHIGDNAGEQDPNTDSGRVSLVASAPNDGSIKKKNKKKKARKAKAKAKKAQNAKNLEGPQEPVQQEVLAVPKVTTYDKGLQTRKEVLGSEHVDRSLSSNSNAFSRPMQDLVTEWAWGNVWNREGLSRQQRSLLNIGLLTALNRTPELAVHIRGAINNGLSELEIREAIIHSTVYCGAPAGMEATRTAERVLREMEEKGEHKRVLV